LNGPTVSRISPLEFDRLADLHGQLYVEDPARPAWEGDQLRARYQGAFSRDEMAVWIARQASRDAGYAWFQVNRGESLLKEVSCRPESRSEALYASLIGAGLDWLRQKGGLGCRYTGIKGDLALEQGLQACGFTIEKEHIQMRASLDAGPAYDASLKTRSFAEIGDASWLLNLVEDCLQCRHAYDRQDLLDLIKRRDSLSFTAWEGDQPLGFLIGRILSAPLLARRSGAHSKSKEDAVFYVEEIGVHPDFRRQGVASRMLAEGFARGRAHGLREAHLHVVGDNLAGLALYRKLGFEEVRREAWWKLSWPDPLHPG
jgi:ribosomal protein S18 acetylase RimI-like enzyme